jgi:hypothetical protein
MKQVHEYEKDIASIRTMMERSSKFISLSGLSGVLAGIYALTGAIGAYTIAYYPVSPHNYRIESVRDPIMLFQLIAIASVVLIASIATALWFSRRKATKQGIKLWTGASRTLLANVSIPLVSGGLFILIMLYTGHLGLAAPSCLIFYGIALIQGSTNTFDEIRYLGFCEIGLGLISALYPGYGLLFWGFGFGVLHIIYGLIMYNKCDR